MSEETISLARRLLKVLLPLGRSVTAELRHTGQLMEPAHFRTMGSLYLHPANLSDLAESQGVSLPSMSNTVTSLEQQGWVKRQRSDKDRRVVMVELTPVGCEKLEELTETVLVMLEKLLKDVTLAERGILSDGVTVLEGILKTIDLPKDPNLE